MLVLQNNIEVDRNGRVNYGIGDDLFCWTVPAPNRQLTSALITRNLGDPSSCVDGLQPQWSNSFNSDVQSHEMLTLMSSQFLQACAPAPPPL